MEVHFSDHFRLLSKRPLGYPKVNVKEFWLRPLWCIFLFIGCWVKEFPRASHSNRVGGVGFKPPTQSYQWTMALWLSRNMAEEFDFCHTAWNYSHSTQNRTPRFRNHQLFFKSIRWANSSRPHDLSNRHPGSPLWEVMNLSYTPRRFVPLPPAVLPPPGQPTTDPIMSGEHSGGC